MSGQSEPGAAASCPPRRLARQELWQVQGARMAVARWGPDAAPIVLLHGALDCGASYQLLADALPADWPLAAVDWRGYGDSEPRRDGYLYVHNLSDLDALLEQLSPGTPVRLVGHSLGGTVAATYAGVRPERVAWLVNLEGFGLLHTRPAAAPARYAAWLEALRRPRETRRLRTYPTLDALAARIMHHNALLTPGRARFLAAAWSRPASDGGLALCADPLHRLATPLRPTLEEFAACWERIRCPALLLWGLESELLRRLGGAGSVEHWRRCVPASAVAGIPGAGHMLHVEQPEACARAIVEFVRGLE